MSVDTYFLGKLFGGHVSKVSLIAMDSETLASMFWQYATDIDACYCRGWINYFLKSDYAFSLT
ncbi:hypothetical protein QWY96_05660 [Vibrio artabrorum]|uniref:Uncharacterized protein n=1 Tax=Vibrio artabrorum TaxID=446374 RepID=A0ABT8CFK5_9VIBR|nr:hypothetical protein [Vibrio artabrorum]MDN3700508.1 hypothetical protein [Vibrio artabrorum]